MSDEITNDDLRMCDIIEEGVATGTQVQVRVVRYYGHFKAGKLMPYAEVAYDDDGEEKFTKVHTKWLHEIETRIEPIETY